MPEPAHEQTRPRGGGSPSQRAERARTARLRSLWQMTPAERVAAMRRGELTYEQLAAWSARHPDEVPAVHGEFEWIVAKLAEVVRMSNPTNAQQRAVPRADARSAAPQRGAGR